ncbi:MAG: hypothetical protein EA398_06170 [Deltaproteobacteria bacterium]|nr:MAG: hypothetical protein EA398_06170 [Deltaproteobacteria bacterium]
MFEIVGERTGTLDSASPEDTARTLRAILAWSNGGTPLRYDLNAQDNWRDWDETHFAVDVSGRRVGLARVVLSDGMIAVDTGQRSGVVQWMRKGFAQPVESRSWPGLAASTQLRKVLLRGPGGRAEGAQGPDPLSAVFCWVRDPGEGDFPDGWRLDSSRDGAWGFARLPAGWR